MIAVECHVCRQRTVLPSSVRCSCGANVNEEDRKRAWAENDKAQCPQDDCPSQAPRR